MLLVRVALCAAVVAVAGCSTDVVGSAPACVDRPYRAELHVDVGDPRKVWATDYETMRDVAVRPRLPGGFTFHPERPTTVLGAGGEVVTFDGEIIVSGCLDAENQTIYIGPVDVPDPNRPPN